MKWLARSLGAGTLVGLGPLAGLGAAALLNPATYSPLAPSRPRPPLSLVRPRAFPPYADGRAGGGRGPLRDRRRRLAARRARPQVAQLRQRPRARRALPARPRLGPLPRHRAGADRPAQRVRARRERCSRSLVARAAVSALAAFRRRRLRERDLLADGRGRSLPGHARPVGAR